MKKTVARQQRRCGHPQCSDDPIEKGETYGIVDGVPYHLECALIVEAERQKV